MDQAIINLYDEYTHRRLTRRIFMERLMTLAGGVTAATTFLGMLENDYARAAVVSNGDPRIAEAGKVTFAADAGSCVSGAPIGYGTGASGHRYP
jgi:carboxymethylenebutenolidase